MLTMLITDGQGRTDAETLAKLEEACASGVTAIQIREKNMDISFALKVRAMTRTFMVTLLINERTDIALAVQADGVHLPEQGVPPCTVKAIQPSLLVGVSTHSLDSALRAKQEGADYLLFGTIFETASKPGIAPQGLAQLSSIVQKVPIPIYAVGGLNLQNYQKCCDAGAHGIAGITNMLSILKQRCTESR